MKKSFWFLLLYGLFSQSLCERSLIPHAVSQIIRDFYFASSERFDIFVYESTKETLSGKILNRIVKIISSDGNFPFKLMKVREDEDKIQISQSAVLIFDTCKAYQDFHVRAELNNVYPKEFYFLIYVHDTINVAEKCFPSADPSRMLRFEIFLNVEGEKDAFTLTTLITMQQPECRKWKQVEINNFPKSLRKWKSREFFLDKYKNFNGCELVIGVPNHAPTCGYGFNREGKLINVWGYGIQIIEQIGNKLNFTIHYNPVLVVAGAPNKIRNESLNIDYFILTAQQRQMFYHQSFQFVHPHTTSEDLIVISRNKPYTQFEKLFLPFEIEVWVWLIVTLLIAVVSILLVKLAPKYVQRFVYGTYVRTPMMNLL